MNPVALVTGAGTGLGAALARMLASAGFDLALHYYRSEAGVLQTRDAITAQGGKADTFRANLALDAQAQGMADALGERFGRLDLLINNAGVYHEAHGLDLTEAEWFQGLDTTVTQTFFTTRAMLPLLRAGQIKRVINIGDSSCDRPGARTEAWSYHVGKTGVWMLTRSFAAEWTGHGIAVNMVSPGVLENSLGLPDVQEMPAGRFGSFTDIGRIVRYLALEAPDYLTGSNLVVSGGWNLR